MLNTQMRIDAYLIPQIDKILSHLFGSQVFSKNDFGKESHQVSVKPSQTHKTTLLTKYGLFDF